MEHKEKNVVVGAGNIAMCDEGAGVWVIRRLMERGGSYPGVEFVEAGTGGINILHLIANRQKCVIIDCAYMDMPPGTIRRFSPAEAKSRKLVSGFSLHEADILSIIDMSRKLNECPDEVVIFGIEPSEIKAGDKLSNVVAAKLDGYVDEICRYISVWQDSQ